MSDDVNSLLGQYQWLWSKQANFRNLWQSTAQFVLPAWDNFVGEFSEGLNRNYRIFSARPMNALWRFSAAIEALLTPRQALYHRLKARQPELNRKPSVKRWFDQVNRTLFAARYHPEANYASQADESYVSLGAFGNGFMFVDEHVGKCMRYRSLPLNELVWAVNHQGIVDTVFRMFKYTAKQAVDHWGIDGVPDFVKDMYRSNNPFQEVQFLHVIRPNEEHVPGAYGYRGKAFDSWYIHPDSKRVLERSGFRVFPGGILRYRVAPRETYGRGPAQDVFPDIRTLNEHRKTELRAGQKIVDPPVLVAEDAVVTPFNMRSAAVNYGMVSQEGKPLAIPFESKGNFAVAKELRQELTDSIDDTFLVTLLKVLLDNPNMTATAVLQLAQEKAERIAPVMGRQQSENLGRQVQREVDVLSEAGQLPPPPREFLDSEGGYEVEYTSPMARALKAEEGTAIMNTVADLAQLMQVDPTTKFRFDAHRAFERMSEIRGCPAELILSEEDTQGLMQHAADQQNAAGLAKGAPAVSASILNMARAAQIAGGGPGGSIPGEAATAAPGAQPPSAMAA